MMALVDCPDCGKRISDRAASCIRCGRPQPPMVTGLSVNPPDAIPSAAQSKRERRQEPIRDGGGNMKKNEAIRAARNGAIAAAISGIVTLAMTVFALSSNTDGDFAPWNDPSALVGSFLIFACAFGMYRKSRASAIVIFVYFTVSKIVMGISEGNVQGQGLSIFIGLIFIYFYGKAVQGTFAYHRLEKAKNPDYEAAPRWYAFLGVPLGLIGIAFVVFGSLVMTGSIPSTRVLAGAKLPQSQTQTLFSEGIVDEGEEIEYFYSHGFTSVLEDGNLLTDRRVISYLINEEGELEIVELSIPDIRNVELVEEGNYLNPSVYQVNSYGEDAWFQIFLSKEAGGDVRFIEALRSKIEQNR